MLFKNNQALFQNNSNTILTFLKTKPTETLFKINFLFPTTCHYRQLLLCLFCFNYFFSLHEFKVEIDNKEIFEKSPNLVI